MSSRISINLEFFANIRIFFAISTDSFAGHLEFFVVKKIPSLAGIGGGTKYVRSTGR